MRPILLLALAPLLLAPLAQAYDCNSSTQTDMTLCANALNKAADKELNTLYQQINQRLKDQPHSKKLLVRTMNHTCCAGRPCSSRLV